MWPPGTDTAMFAAKMRGPVVFPARTRSRIRESQPSTPPTVRIVVTPLINCVRAYFSHNAMPTLQSSALLVISFTIFRGSVGLFFGFPSAGRCTCRLISPGMR